MRSLSALVLLGASLVSTVQAIGPDCANGPLKSNKICDVKASPSERAAALVAAMQTQEKLDNLMRYDMSLENEES
jgi:beta-D-xylosidase 4